MDIHFADLEEEIDLLTDWLAENTTHEYQVGLSDPSLEAGSLYTRRVVVK